MKKLPIGIQTFKDIRSDDYIYVDKTKIALDLIESGRYYFLSRPRRFGKSLFISTLKSIFQSKKELFRDLYIYDKYDWNQSYPVIYISFAEGVCKTREKILEKIEQNFEVNQRDLEIECKKKHSMDRCFKDLIKKAYEKYNQKVVILIDEYDKPILDNINDIEMAKVMREELKNIYSVIKGADEYIKFAFLTGVSKFSKTSIFSGLNNLNDISLDRRYSSICGYTQRDLEVDFKEHLTNVDMQRVKEWYNGYNFLGESLYNPFDILLFISKGFSFRNYWFETGTPSFLIELIKKQNYFLPKLSNLVVGETLLNSFDIENIDLEVVLYQSGYLTIEKEIEKRRGGFEYKLKIPNLEVKISLNDVIIDFLTKQKIEKLKFQDDIYDSLYDLNLELFEDTVKKMFAQIPYNNYTGNKIYEYEGYYASVIYCYLASLGLEIIAEDVTNRGRIDLTIKFNYRVFILEFKVVDKAGSQNSSLAQIREKNYAQKYNGEIYLIGIEFSKEDKNICSFEWEKSV